MRQILTGNFNKESQPHKGWIIGYFMDSSSPFHNKDFEIKWGKHKKGTVFAAKKTPPDNQRSSLSILIYGKYLVKFPLIEKEILLVNEGDYIFYKPNVPHTAEAQKNTLILTIRWPSTPR